MLTHIYFGFWNTDFGLFHGTIIADNNVESKIKKTKSKLRNTDIERN